MFLFRHQTTRVISTVDSIRSSVGFRCCLLFAIFSKLRVVVCMTSSDSLFNHEISFPSRYRCPITSTLLGVGVRRLPRCEENRRPWCGTTAIVCRSKLKKLHLKRMMIQDRSIAIGIRPINYVFIGLPHSILIIP